jgi:hypothetical protein
MKLRSFAFFCLPATLFAGVAIANPDVPAAQCAAWFKSIDRNRDGSIGPNENAARYMNKITLAGAESNAEDDAIMSKRFFLTECRAGNFGRPTL